MGSCFVSSERNCLSRSSDMRSPSEPPVGCMHWFQMRTTIHTSSRWNCFRFPPRRSLQNIPRPSNVSRRSSGSRASAVQCRWERNLMLRYGKHEARIKWVIQLMWIDKSDLHRQSPRIFPILRHRNESRLVFEEWIKFNHQAKQAQNVSISPTNSASPRPSPWRLSPVMKCSQFAWAGQVGWKKFQLTFTEAWLLHTTTRRNVEKWKSLLNEILCGEMGNFLVYLCGVEASDTRQQLISFFLKRFTRRTYDVCSVEMEHFMTLHDAYFLVRQGMLTKFNWVSKWVKSWNRWQLTINSK